MLHVFVSYTVFLYILIIKLFVLTLLMTNKTPRGEKTAFHHPLHMVFEDPFLHFTPIETVGVAAVDVFKSSGTLQIGL